ncbi:hypothetical protein CPB84DRAFT_1157582 [Gymnopilus junonius]|uniref:Uncharacterized protein n=1 Tax=Gymnopilus junonius TaxID=109634 RepID=A0A9P5NLN5_GYMJU|nr:hypothetical protein CPB84DRAFT_1157582 [Gymnopilus junonius]
MQRDVREKIEHALRNAVRCRFDELLKYFLYIILKKDGEEKKELDELQVKIEALQWKRYYIYEKVGHEDKSSQETRQDRSAEDFLNTTEEEKVLIMSRDDILNRLLRNTLESVQPISSDVEVNKLLITLATAFQGTKTAVWSSYVRLCNDVLDRLGNLIVNPVQCPDALNIRFQHDNCYPRVVISSTVALLNAHGDPNPDFTNPPPCQLPWQITLASNEFDVNNERYPKGVVSYLESHVFTSETRNNSLLNAVGTKAMDEEGLEGHNQIHIRPKRSRDVATLGSDEEQPSIKRTRTPSGSKGNSPKSSPTWEITVEQGTKEAKARRFECASYALDMLSYGAGIHHAINLLLTSKFFVIVYPFPYSKVLQMAF